MNNTMQRPVAGRIFKWLYIAATVVLVFTGFAQMPIMKRYYIADIPAWPGARTITPP
jgi:L-asparagine transporter-like permease